MKPGLNQPAPLKKVILSHQNQERVFYYYRPDGVAAEAPALLVLHGSEISVSDTRRLTNHRFEELARRQGFLLIYPQGFKLEWNGCRKNSGTPPHKLNLNDVVFIEKILEHLREKQGAAPRKVFAAGFSNGGQLALRLALSIPEKIAGIAVVAAMMPTSANNSCPPARQPVPVLFMNGTSDPLIPFQGGQASFYGFRSAGNVKSQEKSLLYWRKVNKTDERVQLNTFKNSNTNDGSTVLGRYWTSSQTGAPVLSYTIQGGGHTWPGGYQYFPSCLIGSTNRDIQAADEIWAFFASIQ